MRVLLSTAGRPRARRGSIAGPFFSTFLTLPHTVSVDFAAVSNDGDAGSEAGLLRRFRYCRQSLKEVASLGRE